MADAIIAEPAAEAPAPAPAVKSLSLRLDDGTLIRRDAKTAQGVVLKTEEAWKAGLLKEEHLLHLQALLCEQHSKLPEEAPPKSISTGSKRSSDSVVEVGTPAAQIALCSFAHAVCSPLRCGWPCTDGAVWFRPDRPLEAPAFQ
jgi:hypothetical protein